MMDGEDGDFEMDSAFDEQRQGFSLLPGLVPSRVLAGCDDSY